MYDKENILEYIKIYHRQEYARINNISIINTKTSSIYSNMLLVVIESFTLNKDNINILHVYIEKNNYLTFLRNKKIIYITKKN